MQYMLMRDEEERSKQGHTNNKAKQHNTPKAVTFQKKDELPQVGCTYMYMCLVYSTYLNDSVFNPLRAAVMELASLWVSAGVPTLHSDQGGRAVA